MSTKRSTSLPWTEKYRPYKLDQIIGQEEIIKLFKKSIETGELPHLLLYGPPGTGKTSSIFAYAMEQFGPNNFKHRVIEVNASDERGINVVRSKIIEFTAIQLSTPDKNYPSPNYKLIILDEADTLTNEAQSALRKVLEDNSENTRFCFLCNYLNRIIDPIISRCNKYCFKPLDNNLVISRIADIVKQENINLSQEVIETIANITEGDLRRSISVLQNIKYLYNYKLSKNLDVTVDDVKELCGLMPMSLEVEIKNICFNKNVKINKINKLSKRIIANSYTIYSVVDSVMKLILDYELDDVNKSKILWYLLDIEKQLLAGSDEYLQLLSLLTHIHNVIKNT